jgi:hypothetical protein
MEDLEILTATIVFALFIIIFMLYIGFEEVKKRVNKSQAKLNKMGHRAKKNVLKAVGARRS